MLYKTAPFTVHLPLFCYLKLVSNKLEINVRYNFPQKHKLSPGHLDILNLFSVTGTLLSQCQGFSRSPGCIEIILFKFFCRCIAEICFVKAQMYKESIASHREAII